MPKMDGYQAATEMRAIEKANSRDGRPSVIIAVTALASEDEKRKGLVECGIDEWICKPFSKATITQRVDKARKELCI
jgi:CheY-like chemotaxis protein